jgi:hypothetical protein
MSNKEFSEKLKAGIELAGKRMLEDKAIRGEDIMVSSDGKTIQRITAKELLAETATVQTPSGEFSYIREKKNVLLQSFI